MTALGRRMNENISPRGRQKIPTPPNIYRKYITTYAKFMLEQSH